jgi:16S rRNA (adenine1518-N6/adenine1519-N6)-dimethyltransferase
MRKRTEQRPGRRHPASASAQRPPLRRSLGQHHLTSASTCRPLLELLKRAGGGIAGGGGVEGDSVVRENVAADIVIGDVVGNFVGDTVEIGAGGGVLTAALAELSGRVCALELDPAWAFHLRRRFGGAVSVAVVDALDIAWQRLDARFTSVVGNLPYNVATAIIERLLDSLPAGKLLGFLVQREVAERIVAVPGTKEYGAFSVLVQARGRPRILGRVTPGSFHPPPKVHSAFLALRLEAWSADEVSWPYFKRVVRDAFGHRRKTLVNSLRLSWGDRALAVLGALDLEPAIRPERVDVAGYRRLALLAARHGVIGPPDAAPHGSNR